MFQLSKPIERTQKVLFVSPESRLNIYNHFKKVHRQVNVNGECMVTLTENFQNGKYYNNDFN